MTADFQEAMQIRALVENWAIWRDSGDWNRLRTVWHDDGLMVATWFQGTAEAFIQASEASWKRGVSVLHFLGGCSIDLAGNRAVAQTKMTISQRALVHGIPCDCVCTGRFYDFFEKRQGAWGLVLRQPIYEKDRLDPVDTSVMLAIDREKLASLPSGYRHLAYIQIANGMTVNLGMPGAQGPEVNELYERGRKWLAGFSPLCAQTDCR